MLVCVCAEQAHVCMYMCMSIHVDMCMHGKCAATEPSLGPGVFLVKTGRKPMVCALCSAFGSYHPSAGWMDQMGRKMEGAGGGM